MAEQRWTPTHVQVTVLQARDLHPKGRHGGSDTYSVLQLGREKYRTSVVERSLCPVWREEAAFPLPGLLEPHSPEQWRLLVTVMQRSLLGPDRFLGEVAINLRGLCDRRERRTGWYRLASRPGKRQKPRGELQVSVQFMRSHLTASMFDLSMKDRGRSPFSRLKDKMKGRRPEGSDTASAIVPGSVSDRLSVCPPQIHSKAKKPFLLGPQRLSSAQSMSDLYGPPTSQQSCSGPQTNVAPESISPAEENGNLPSPHRRTMSTDPPTDESPGSRDPEVGGSGGIQKLPLSSVSLPQKFATLPRQWAPGYGRTESPERCGAPETLASGANGKKNGKRKEKVGLFQRVTGKRPERHAQDGASHEATNPFWEGARISSGTTAQIERTSGGSKIFPPVHGPPNPFEGPGPYTHLTRTEVEWELVKHKELLKKKDGHIRQLEDYIDNLLVRVMEETPSILRVPYVPSRKLGKFPQS